MSVVHVSLESAEEKWQEKLARKFKENPLVPIGKFRFLLIHVTLLSVHLVDVGAGLTCWALFMATKKAGANGDPKALNRWFRMRILFQGATVVALVAGTYTMQQNQLNGTSDQESEEDKKVRERMEFETRLRGAEEAHALEQAIVDAKNEDKRGVFEKLGLGRGSFKNREAAQAAAATVLDTPVTSVKPEPPSPTPSTSGSWWSWFGGRSSKSDK